MLQQFVIGASLSKPQEGKSERAPYNYSYSYIITAFHWYGRPYVATYVRRNPKCHYSTSWRYATTIYVTGVICNNNATIDNSLCATWVHAQLICLTFDLIWYANMFAQLQKELLQRRAGKRKEPSTTTEWPSSSEKSMQLGRRKKPSTATERGTARIKSDYG